MAGFWGVGRSSQLTIFLQRHPERVSGSIRDIITFLCKILIAVLQASLFDARPQIMLNKTLP